METMQNTGRLVLFGVTFTIGATVVCLAALCDDLVQYYAGRQQLATAQRNVELLSKLNTEFDALLDQVRQDPNLVKRTAPATLGTWPQEPNTAHPTVHADELLTARQTLFMPDDAPEQTPALPPWLARCSQPFNRAGLFLSGAGLVLVAFVCFRPQAAASRLRSPGLVAQPGTPAIPEPPATEAPGLGCAPDEEPRG